MPVEALSSRDVGIASQIDPTAKYFESRHVGLHTGIIATILRSGGRPVQPAVKFARNLTANILPGRLSDLLV